MRRVFIFALLLTTALASAEQPTAHARVEQRRAGIERMKLEDRAEAYAKLSLELADLASEQLQAGDPSAKDTLAAIGEAAVRSLEAAQRKHKKVKQSEMILRQTGRRLEDMKRSQSVLEQAPFKQPMEQVEDAHKKLLELMFRK